MTSTTESNPKKRSHNGAGKNEDPVIFKILEGNMKTSDYASLCLLVPEAVAEELAEALRKARSGGQFVWTIGDDEADMVSIRDLVENATVPAGGYLVVMTKVALEDGSEIGFGLKKDGSETLFVTMFTDGWSVDVPESLGEDLSYARTPNGAFEWENGVTATPGAEN